MSNNKHFKSVTVNVQGIRNKVKRNSVFEWLKNKNVDICLLQETHCHLRKESKIWEKEWGGKCLWSFGTNRSKGCAVLFKNNFIHKYENVLIDPNGRYIIFDLICNNDTVYKIVNIYAPTTEYERVMFMKNMHDWFKDVSHEVLIGGDFNCVLNNKLDRFNCVEKTDIGQVDIKHLQQTYDLEEVWRSRYPTKKQYSWWGRNKASRIDYWLTSSSLNSQIDKIKYEVFPFSDHDAVLIDFRISETEHGKGIWKMNVSILDTPLFQKMFSSMWSEWKERKSEFVHIQTWWDLGKKKIKDIAISCSKILNNEKNKMTKYLEDKIPFLRTTPDKNIEIAKLECELKSIYENRAHGARIRSRVQWWEEGERSSKYFHNLEKRNAKDKSWHKILEKDNTLSYGTEKILNRQVEFYKDLYSSGHIEQTEGDFFINYMPNEKILSEESKLFLDKELSLNELYQSMSKMKLNKSPGPDGIPVEFYKKYWSSVGTDLHEVLVTSYSDDELPYTQYLALITLLYKKGARENIKNWRPISLLNVDLKILSKALAERLKKVLHEIIHVDQQGCIPGRYIGKNIRLLEDIINEQDDDAVILVLDQEKAFDRVEWNWIYRVLHQFKLILGLTL